MPEPKVRKILTNLLFLILAANGIACACPSVAVDVPTHDHGMHVGDDTSPEQCHTADCEGGCDSLSNTQALDEAALTAAIRLGADLDDFPTLLQLSLFHDLRRSLETIHNSPGVDRDPGIRATPVSLSDRMLD